MKKIVIALILWSTLCFGSSASHLWQDYGPQAVLIVSLAIIGISCFLGKGGTSNIDRPSTMEADVSKLRQVAEWERYGDKRDQGKD